MEQAYMRRKKIRSPIKSVFLALSNYSHCEMGFLSTLRYLFYLEFNCFIFSTISSLLSAPLQYISILVRNVRLFCGACFICVPQQVDFHGDYMTLHINLYVILHYGDLLSPFR